MISSLFNSPPSRDSLHLYETSWLLPPLVLAILRALISLYIFTTIFFIWGWDGTHGDRDQIGQSFSYFTWLTYWGLGFYFCFAAIHTACYALTGRSVLFDRWPRFLRVLHVLFYTTITTFPFLVTIVFWAILFKPPWYSVTFTGWSNISQHALNSLYALLEIILPTTSPHPLITLPCLIFLLLLYVSLAYLTYHTEGFYTYSFLDPGPHGKDSGLVAGYCFGILAAILVIFGISWALIWLRGRVTAGKVKRSVYDREREESRNEMETVGVGVDDVETKA
ncbi:hypothetical protein ASPWEDRAFT_169628 [Aspergillus wentii DTO 134E9]|uniref:FAR-17a/AIG1-like protein n=1 Tax=Aspergillus wentii DTO 134E9 TaxID=1073089 RepID=A0A1L9RY47_ASPWE|nr:uncharacterized protein ASPWEDRAFT_169628 [Aspergillus wentii DTO 134E9]KAI9931528.1 hypothetical protein MW887_010105 [Aspergillus wentii]OJJ39804.1 hypothetical protein ASPWEDRAFT_169628 [Aspergillus wentii DTO 134E9]